MTIKAKENKVLGPNQVDEWKILVKRHKLMENVHGESGASKIFTFHKENVFFLFFFFCYNNDYDLSDHLFKMLNKDISSVHQLRFILQQPSANWKDFGLDEIRLKINNPVSFFKN